jgi:hypothetical protein
MKQRNRRVLLGLGAASVLAAALSGVIPGAPSGSMPSAVAPGTTAAKPADRRFASLPEREAIGPSHGELFGPRSWTPGASELAARQQGAAPAAPAKPVAPPVPYRIAGQVVGEDGMRVVLVKGDRIVEAREGQVLEDGLRLDAIKPRSVVFTYVPLGLSQELAVEGTALDLPPLRTAIVRAPSAQPEQSNKAPAKIQFEGPTKVQAGKPFDVALKVTSARPVRALPMQLSFDAKRLEPLAVRPGELFADGKFTYRLNASGSIFVGGSGAGRVAANTGFFVVTFRPIAAGPAELKVSSLLVQDAAGRTIVHEPPEVFRAAIVQ